MYLSKSKTLFKRAARAQILELAELDFNLRVHDQGSIPLGI